MHSTFGVMSGVPAEIYKKFFRARFPPARITTAIDSIKHASSGYPKGRYVRHRALEGIKFNKDISLRYIMTYSMAHLTKYGQILPNVTYNAPLWPVIVQND